MNNNQKPSKKVIRDFNFLVHSDLHSIGISLGCESDYDPNGASALDAWFSLDSLGRTIPCREPELHDLAISGKASWNLQIAEWANDLADGMLLTIRELNEYTNGHPAWIKKSAIKQARAIVLKNIGFIPSFLYSVT